MFSHAKKSRVQLDAAQCLIVSENEAAKQVPLDQALWAGGAETPVRSMPARFMPEAARAPS